MTSADNTTLEARLSDDPEGSERDKLLQVLKAFEQELDEALKKGCAPAEYKRIGEVLTGARVAQGVLVAYHNFLNKEA
ncbi:MAG: hypothetical protein OXD47_00140 [Gammaproteobacteria bacterium]|nr:hypothetical protein [Gammaproteobacteria bacterium]MCY4210773.1 hypothetical protein [Gammaproteobacteria bacterium]MCY4283459.1 hypothetical protein [Gammaproteobacteria bacterium]MCY4337193.1 hypothetical protein [Gammaproteobacteria bacterium]